MDRELCQYPDGPELGVQTEAERAVCARLRTSTAFEEAEKEEKEERRAWLARVKAVR